MPAIRPAAAARWNPVPGSRCWGATAGWDVPPARRSRVQRLLCGVVQMVLVAEGQHLVTQQGRADGGELRLGQVGGERDAGYFGADAAGNGADREGGCCVGTFVRHERLLRSWQRDNGCGGSAEAPATASTRWPARAHVKRERTASGGTPPEVFRRNGHDSGLHDRTARRSRAPGRRVRPRHRFIRGIAVCQRVFRRDISVFMIADGPCEREPPAMPDHRWRSPSHRCQFSTCLIGLSRDRKPAVPPRNGTKRPPH